MALHTTPTIDKYTVKEVLNQVINTDADALKVDIDNVTLKTEGSDINIEVHTDKAEDSMMIWTHTVKTGTGGTSYVPLVDGDGHLQVDTLSSALPSGAATAANQVTIIGHVDGVETLLTAANVDHAANEVLLTGIDADTDAIKTDMAAIEVLITSTNSKIDTFDAVLDSILTKNTEIDAVLDTIKVDTELLDNAIDGTEMQVDVVAALPAGSNTIGVVDLGSTDNAVLDAMVVDLAAMEVLLTAANVDHAANEVLLGTIDSDTNDIKTATEASNTHLGNMFYDTALAVTPSDGSDLSGEPFYAVYVGTGGNLKVDMADGGSAVTLSNVASGQLLPIMVERIYSTGTTASNIIAFK